MQWDSTMSSPYLMADFSVATSIMAPINLTETMHYAPHPESHPNTSVNPSRI